MKNIKSILFISSLILSVAGCEKDADVELPEVEPKLVIASFISPQDTLVKVWVRQTKPIFKPSNVNTSDAVIDATVEISDGTTSATLTFDPSGSHNGYYQIATSVFPIVENKTYSLRVSTPDGKVATAISLVPAFSPVNLTGDVNIITIDSSATYYERESHYTVSWDDVAGSGNNYRVIALKAYYDPFYNDTMYTTIVDAYINDEGKEGQRLEYKTTSWESSYSSGGGGTGFIVGYNYYVYLVNDDYYRYNTSVRISGFSSQDPFSEPTLVYSNVTGGLGAFCAFNELGRVIKR